MSLSAEDISCILIFHANRFSFKGRISNPGTGKQAYTAELLVQNSKLRLDDKNRVENRMMHFILFLFPCFFLFQ